MKLNSSHCEQRTKKKRTHTLRNCQQKHKVLSNIQIFTRNRQLDLDKKKHAAHFLFSLLLAATALLWCSFYYGTRCIISFKGALFNLLSAFSRSHVQLSQFFLCSSETSAHFISIFLLVHLSTRLGEKKLGKIISLLERRE